MDCKSKSKKNETCGSCGEEGVKYRCPSCLRRTCSLQCVKDHKKRFSCTGIRSKTTYVSKGDYNENNLISDYRFLEDTERVAYTANSSQTKKTRHFNRNATNLLKKSHSSGVRLRLMPVGMKKRMLNTTVYDNRAKRIMWRVKWIFPQADAEYVDKRVSEKEVIQDLLKKYLDPDESDPVIRQRLKIYFQTDINKICVLLKKEYQPANQERYYLLDKSQTLQQNLTEKTVIEFPSLHVVLPEYTGRYPIQDTQTTTPPPSQPIATQVNNIACVTDLSGARTREGVTTQDTACSATDLSGARAREGGTTQDTACATDLSGARAREGDTVLPRIQILL